MAIAETALATIGILAGCIWVGSLVCLAVVARTATSTLDPAARVALFKDLGRVYGPLGTGALLVAIVVGAAVAASSSTWTPSTVTALVLALILVLLTAAGMAQARRMSSLRRQALAVPENGASSGQVRDAARRAATLRGAMAALTLVIVVLIASEITS